MSVSNAVSYFKHVGAENEEVDQVVDLFLVGLDLFRVLIAQMLHYLLLCERRVQAFVDFIYVRDLLIFFTT